MDAEGSMPRPNTIKGAPSWRRQPDGPAPQCLDDIADRIGSGLDALRATLGGELEIAVAVARDASDREVVLVATRTGLRVWPRLPGDARHDVTSWPRVRVSPVRQDHGAVHAERASHSCDVRVDELTFVVSADGPSTLGAVRAFHDEVVRRGTPWHYPG
jgi:hypothetical protein